MAAFDVVRHTPLGAEAAWARLTDWPSHSKFIPFTEVRVTSEVTEGVGTVFVAHTSLGWPGFDDPMEVTYWQPPTDHRDGVCRIVKLGRVVTGWAVLTVAPAGRHSRLSSAAVPSPTKREGATIRWVEQAQFRAAGPWLNWPNALVGRLVFGRLMDGLLTQR